ncbi:MAG: class I SAM-dependent methyltransferase [Deltaproteobacteria bacterium]|nr:class I SAM-dependent methyltransferase [Deltaproteobacteria bacterium]
MKPLNARRESNLLKYLYYIIRNTTAPFKQVLKYIPGDADILDLGCGYGILIDFMSAKKNNCKVTGIDINVTRIETLKEKYPHHRFIAGDVLAEAKRLYAEKAGFDCIILFDVLYLMPPEKQKELIHIASRLLRPSGVFLIKEMDTEARLRFSFSYLQEFFSVKVMKITKGDGLYFMSKEDISGELCANNMQTEIIKMGSIFHPHTLIIGRKPREVFHG